MDDQHNDHLYQLRHTGAHVLAAVLKQLYPDIQLAIGPAIDDGFYYDVDSATPITDQDLPKIEKAIKNFIRAGAPMVGHEITLDEAREHFKDAPYKLELIEEFAGEGKNLTEYALGDFVDLCKGGHLENANQINPDGIKLSHVAGAYWRGDEKNKMLTRIYALAFDTKEELDAHLKMLEEAKKRDHRKLGQELDLFVFSDLVGPGLPLFTPRGTVILTELAKFIYELQEPYGYQRVDIPHLAKPELYKRSGHWDKFKDDIFHVFGKNNAEFVLKPMNCPHHAQIFASKHRSYRELPLRFAEITKMYRDENPGQLQGLSRVRSITIDDAHVFCRPDQIQQEVMNMMDIAEKIYPLYGIELLPTLSVRDPKTPQKYLGSDEGWKNAEEALKEVLKLRGVTKYDLDIGGAAFYGPKIDLSGVDAIGRKWQLSTFQIDFNQPEGLGLTYVNEQNEEVRPIMVHRALLGSMERHLMVLLEHFAGNLPLWLSPVHFVIAPVSDAHREGAMKLAARFREAGMRVDVDESSETVGRKVRNAAKLKTPYIVVYGDKEQSSDQLMIRVRGVEEQRTMSVSAFIEDCKHRIAERSQEL